MSEKTSTGLSVSVMRTPKLDWEVLRLFLQLSPALLLPVATGSVENLRRKWQLCVKAFSSREAVGMVEDKSFLHADHEVALRIYTPEPLLRQAARPALLWIHGGGFVLGDLYTAGATCRKLANACNCVVVAVRYRLAPEHSLHTSLGDCLQAFQWLATRAPELGLDPDRIAVGGDSAGGALAALVAQNCTEPAAPQPVAQLLIYPATDLTGHYPEDTGAPLPNRMLGALFRWLQTQIPPSDLGDARLSPAAKTSLKGVAPLVVVTAGFDPLRDDALAYANRLAAQGISVRILHFPGQFHGFVSFDAVLHGARLAFTQIGDEFGSVLRGDRLKNGVACTDVNGPASWGWLWLRPSQRLRELQVVALMACEFFRRSSKVD